MAESNLTAERLRELVNYDPESGIFTWRIPRRKCTVGARVGHQQKRGYWNCRLDYHNHYLHRIAWLYMTGEWPTDEIDHIDRDKSNNVWSNLRSVGTQQNMQNVGIRRSNSSGATGVSWSKIHEYWLARIKVNYKSITIGYFSTFEDALAARKQAEKQYFTVPPAS